MANEWLDAVRSTLPEESKATSGGTRQLSLSWTHLDPVHVRPERTPEGEWRIHASDRLLATLPDDDGLLEILGLEWAGAVEVTQGDEPERLWLCRGNWVTVQVPEGFEWHEVRAKFGAELNQVAELQSSAQEKTFDDLVEMLPKTDAQEDASGRRAARRLFAELPDDAVTIEPLDDEALRITSTSAVDPDEDDPDDTWRSYLKDASGDWARVYSFSDDELVDLLSNQEDFPKAIGVQIGGGGLYFAYNHHVIHGQFPRQVWESEGRLVLRGLYAMILADPRYLEPGAAAALSRFDRDDPAAQRALDRPEGRAGSGEDALPWARAAEDGDVELIVWPGRAMYSEPDVRHPGRWSLVVWEPAHPGEDDEAYFLRSMDVPELRAMVDAQEENPWFAGRMPSTDDVLVWRYRDHVVLTRHAGRVDPAAPSAEHVIAAHAQVLRGHPRLSAPGDEPGMLREHVALEGPRRDRGRRHLLQPAHPADPGIALWIVGDHEVEVRPQLVGQWTRWTVHFGDAAVPLSYTFGQGPEDVHQPTDVPERLSAEAGAFAHFFFARILDGQWHLPAAVAVDDDELLWLYRGWWIASKMPQSWLEHTLTRRSIVMRLWNQEPHAPDRLREWRAQTAGTTSSGGIAAAVRARAARSDERLAEEVDWMWGDLPLQAPVLPVTVLDDGEVRVTYRDRKWVFIHSRTGEAMTDYDDKNFAFVLDRQAIAPAWAGVAASRWVYLFRGHFASVPFDTDGTDVLVGHVPPKYLGDKRTQIMMLAHEISVALEPAVAEPADPTELQQAKTLLADLLEEPEVEEHKREHIPQRVRHEVWRRDEAKCVDCGSRNRLEFDHIIPVSKGGANTARNIQLLCQDCNRRKSANM